MWLITDNQQLSGGEGEKEKWDLNRSVSELEESLREVLSDVLEVEMKAAYEELWLEVNVMFWEFHMIFEMMFGWIILNQNPLCLGKEFIVAFNVLEQCWGKNYS